MKIINTPEMIYVEDNCFAFTFKAKKVKKLVEDNCKGKILNLFAGKNRLAVSETRVDISDEFHPDYHLGAENFLSFALDNCMKFDTIIYDPPWNDRKSKEFYNGKYIGKFTKLKKDIVSILNDKGIIISAGYEISNFGKGRKMKVKKVYVINPFGEIRPYFISIEQLVYINQINNYLEVLPSTV